MRAEREGWHMNIGGNGRQMMKGSRNRVRGRERERIIG